MFMSQFQNYPRKVCIFKKVKETEKRASILEKRKIRFFHFLISFHTAILFGLVSNMASSEAQYVNYFTHELRNLIKTRGIDFCVLSFKMSYNFSLLDSFL